MTVDQVVGALLLVGVAAVALWAAVSARPAPEPDTDLEAVAAAVGVLRS